MNDPRSDARAVARILSRAAWIVLSGLVVAGAAFLWLGPAAIARQYPVKIEVERFTPTIGHGLIQLGGETFLLVLVAYVARRWLRVRL